MFSGKNPAKSGVLGIKMGSAAVDRPSRSPIFCFQRQKCLATFGSNLRCTFVRCGTQREDLNPKNGDRLLRLDVAYQLAQIYGMTVDELIKK
ncbi:MAG TPA: hypothetical protein GX717_07680 [Clostridiaceae bacterium]|nr:hypothetical protein [Clostridiaceae bacterium]